MWKAAGVSAGPVDSGSGISTTDIPPTASAGDQGRGVRALPPADRSLHVLAAVDGDVRAGDERRLVRAEVDDQSRHLVGLAEATHRDLRDDLRVQHLLG